jgi:hypothetical protein
MLFSQKDYPNLHSGNHRDTEPPDPKYNCIAWAAGRTDKWWDPAEPEEGDDNLYWPENVPRDHKVTSLIMALESVGFIICADGCLEDGIEKIAAYADGPEYTHAARQLENGKWTSKMGPDERIEHDTPEDVVGPAYGQVTAFMKRPRPGAK